MYIARKCVILRVNVQSTAIKATLGAITTTIANPNKYCQLFDNQKFAYFRHHYIVNNGIDDKRTFTMDFYILDNISL